MVSRGARNQNETKTMGYARLLIRTLKHEVFQLNLCHARRKRRCGLFPMNGYRRSLTQSLRREGEGRFVPCEGGDCHSSRPMARGVRRIHPLDTDRLFARAESIARPKATLLGKSRMRFFRADPSGALLWRASNVGFELLDDRTRTFHQIGRAHV